MRHTDLDVRQIELVQKSLLNHSFVLGDKLSEGKYDTDAALGKDSILMEVAAVALRLELLESHGRLEVLRDGNAELEKKARYEVNLLVVFPATALVSPTNLLQIGQVEEAHFVDQLHHDFDVERVVAETDRAFPTEGNLKHALVELLEHSSDPVLAGELVDEGEVGVGHPGEHRVVVVLHQSLQVDPACHLILLVWRDVVTGHDDSLRV